MEIRWLLRIFVLLLQIHQLIRNWNAESNWYEWLVGSGRMSFHRLIVFFTACLLHQVGKNWFWKLFTLLSFKMCINSDQVWTIPYHQPIISLSSNNLIRSRNFAYAASWVKQLSGKVSNNTGGYNFLKT